MNETLETAKYKRDALYTWRIRLLLRKRSWIIALREWAERKERALDVELTDWDGAILNVIWNLDCRSSLYPFTPNNIGSIPRINATAPKDMGNKTHWKTISKLRTAMPRPWPFCGDEPKIKEGDV